MSNGQAIIPKLPKRKIPIQKLGKVGKEGWGWKDSSYTAMSGEDRLNKLIKLLRKQGVRYRVMDEDFQWRVKWL